MEATDIQKKLKTIYETKLKTSTLREFEEWRASKEGLLLTCKAYSFDPRYCAAEMEALREAETREREKKWLECCERAWGFDWTTKEAKRKLGTLEHLEEAEHLMMEQLFIPPHFTRIKVCAECSPVAVSARYLEVATCPWCPYLKSSFEAIGYRPSEAVLARAEIGQRSHCSDSALQR